MQISKIDVLQEDFSNDIRMQQSQIRNFGTFLHSGSIVHSNLFNSQESKYDFQSLKQFYKSLKQMKEGEDRNVTEKTQITNVINNVFGLLRQVMRLNGKDQFFQQIFRLYIQLLKSKQNSQHYFSLVEQHLKELIQIDFHKYRKNKKIFYFIAKIFPQCPHTVYKILQSKNQKNQKIQLFQNDTKEAIQVYKCYINFAAQKKNCNNLIYHIDLLLHQYIRTELNSDNPSIQKLTILLSHIKEKLSLKFIEEVQLKLSKIIQSAKKYWRQSCSQKKLIDLIQVFLHMDWPAQAKKHNSILKYIEIWNKQQQSTQKQTAISKFIKNLSSLSNQVAVFEQIKSKLTFYIIEKISVVQLKKQKNSSKDLNLTFPFINTLFQKLGRSNTEKLIQKQYLDKWIHSLLEGNYQLREGLITVLSTIKKLNIHDLGIIIQRLLMEKIKVVLSSDKLSIMIRPYSQIYRGEKLRMEENSQSKQKNPQDMIFCIKAFRYFSFNKDAFTILYSMIKRYVLKKGIINIHPDFKKQVVKACLYIIGKIDGEMQSKNILNDVIGLVRQDIKLKQQFIKWSSESQDFYSKKLFQVFNTNEHLELLFHDFSSKQLTIKSFSIKILCILYPYNPCQIVPFLKKTYYEIYDRLSVEDMVKFPEKKTGLKLIRQIIRHRTQIITDDANQFCKFLYKQLNKSISGFHQERNLLTIQILKTFNSLMRRLPKHIFPYTKSIANYIIQLINSKYTQNQIKKVAIQTFNQMIVNCGYVVLPYFHFKNLLLIFREILKSDDNNQIYKNQLLKLIGGLGYVSRQKYFRLNKLTQSTQSVKQIQSHFEKTFKQINYLKEIKSCIQIEQIKLLSSDSSYYNKEKSVKTYIENFNYREYIISKTLKHINQNSTNIVFFNTFKTLEAFIFILPKNQQNIYQKLVFQHILIGNQKFPIQNTMSLLTKIVNKQEFKEYSNELFIFFFKHLDDTQHRKKCLESLFRITILYSNSLEIKTKQFILKIRKITLDLNKQKAKSGTSTQEIIYLIRLCFGIINNLASHLDNFLHLFLPDFNSLFLLRPQKICLTYFCLLFNLFKNSGSIEYFLSQILEHLFNLLKSQIEIKKTEINHSFIQKTINFYICVLLFYGDKAKGFTQNFHYLLKISNVKNPFYRIVEDFLKKNSCLYNLHYSFTKGQLNQLFRFQYMSIDIAEHIESYKHDSQLNASVIHQIIEQFNCDNNQIEQESEEWFNTLSILLFQKSQQPFIRACSALVKEDKILCNDLFQFAFYFLWNILSNDLKKKLTMKLKFILQKNTISLRVKQKFIDAIYFMEQCQFPIQLTDNVLREASQEVLDLAKSLFYMEKIYLQDPQVHGEPLINMYIQMGQIQSALGLINIVPNLNTKTKIVLYQKLNKHMEALKQLQTLKDKTKFQTIQLQIKIRKQMYEWETVISKCQKLQKHKGKLSHLAVQAAINLGRWDQVKKYLPIVDANHENTNLWKAMLNIYEKKYDDVPKFIKKDRQIIYPKICQLFNFSFQRNMEGVIRLQRLAELQQANQFLKIQATQALNVQERKRHKISVAAKKKQIQLLWNDRMEGANNNLWAMREILLHRNLLFSKSEDIDNWISYGKLALKEGQSLLCKRAIQSMINQVTEPKKKILIQLLFVQCKFMMGQLNDEVAVQQVQKIIQEKGTLNISLHQYYYKNALWLSQKQFDFNLQKALKSIQMLDLSVKSFKTYIKGWHLLGLTHYKIVQLYQNKKTKVQKRASNVLSSSKQIYMQDLDSSFRNNKQSGKQLKQQKQQKYSRQYHILQSLHSFIRSVCCGVRNHQYFLQDCLKIMNIIFIEQEVQDILQELQKSYIDIPSQGLIQIIPQIIGRLDIVQKPGLLNIMKKLLIHIGNNHPQALVFPLIYLKRGTSRTRKLIAQDILKQLNKKEGSQMQQIYLDADKIAEQLCKVSLKLNQKFIIFMGKISSKSILKGVCSVGIAQNYLTFIQDMLSEDPAKLSVSQFGFIIQYRQDFTDICNKLKLYIENNQTELFKKAQTMIRSILSENKKNLEEIKKIYLQQVSPTLHRIKKSKMVMFGTYKPNSQQIHIDCFKNEVSVINSKQRPKKLIAIGSDQKSYNYLLKGKEDLRLDQRIMQLISLINKMFHEPSERQNYSIMGYSITPISLQTGIISWVQNCDTIGEIIHKQRSSSSSVFLERQISRQICQVYHVLPKAQKVQIYHQIQSRVSGTDLKNVFWIRSSSSQDWLKSRTTYIRSLAVMSIVGYIIGLGDRHPNNIMIQKDTGQIVHIDFGDCFDVNKMRKQFPQKVPFRLTRMLVKAMQPCGVIGIFRQTCQKIINLLRNNKQSIIAIVQAFKYDPLIGWRLVKDGDQQNKMLQHSFQDNDESFLTKLGEQKKKNDKKQGKNIDFAQHILNQIKNKLNGRNSHNAAFVLKPQEQVQMLIRQAMSPQNLVQHYEGWSIYW